MLGSAVTVKFFTRSLISNSSIIGIAGFRVLRCVWIPRNAKRFLAIWTSSVTTRLRDLVQGWC